MIVVWRCSAPIQGNADIVVFSTQEFQAYRLAPSNEMGPRFFRKRQEMSSMPVTKSFLFIGKREHFSGILAHRFEQLVSALAEPLLIGNEALVDEQLHE